MSSSLKTFDPSRSTTFRASGSISSSASARDGALAVSRILTSPEDAR
jgi:hypothetical protein